MTGEQEEEHPWKRTPCARKRAQKNEVGGSVSSCVCVSLSVGLNSTHSATVGTKGQNLHREMGK